MRQLFYGHDPSFSWSANRAGKRALTTELCRGEFSLRPVSASTVQYKRLRCATEVKHLRGAMVIAALHKEACYLVIRRSVYFRDGG